MRKKIKYDNLYVAFPVYDHEVETEIYEQYETFGKIEHRIIVNPKMKLIYSIIDEHGNERFYDYKTNEEVVDDAYESSFETPSSALKSLYCAYINGFIVAPFKEMRESFIKQHNDKMKKVGYFIPLKKYMKDKYGFDIKFLTPALADKLIHLINICAKKSFILSMDIEEAELQLQEIGYHKKTEKKRIL